MSNSNLVFNVLNRTYHSSLSVSCSSILITLSICVWSRQDRQDRQVSGCSISVPVLFMWVVVFARFRFGFHVITFSVCLWTNSVSSSHISPLAAEFLAQPKFRQLSSEMDQVSDMLEHTAISIRLDTNFLFFRN